MKANEFARTHPCAADWIAAMGDREVVALQPGQRGTHSGFPATVLRHYHDGMYEIRVPGGPVCVDASEFIPA